MFLLKRFLKPRLDAFATGRTSTVEGLEENQKKAFLEFREYSRKFLTENLENFKQDRKDQISKTFLLSGELGKDKSFRGFLVSLTRGYLKQKKSSWVGTYTLSWTSILQVQLKDSWK